jgi:hypothetical protein
MAFIVRVSKSSGNRVQDFFSGCLLQKAKINFNFNLIFIFIQCQKS